MVVGNGEGHQLVETELAGPVPRHEGRAHRGEPQPLADDARADPEARGDLLEPQALLLVESGEGLDLVGRMHGEPNTVLGQAELGRLTIRPYQAGDRLAFAEPFFLPDCP